MAPLCKMMLLVMLLLLHSATATAAAAVQADYESVALNVLAGNPSPMQSYLAASILHEVASNPSSFSQYCAPLSAQLKPLESVQSISALSRALSDLSCPISLSPSQCVLVNNDPSCRESAVLSALESDLKDCTAAIFAASAAKLHFDSEKAYAHLFAMKQSDGSFRNSANPKSQSSVRSASYIFELFAKYPKASYAPQLQKSFDSLLEELEIQNNQLYFQESPEIPITAAMVAGYYSFSTKPLSAAKSQAFAKFFQTKLHTRDLEEMLALARVMNAYARSSLPQPVDVTLPNAFLPKSAAGVVLLRVETLLGSAITDARVQLTAVNGKALPAPKVAELSNKDYKLALPGDHSPGVYRLSLEVSLKASSAVALPFEVSCTISTDVEFSSTKVSVRSGKEDLFSKSLSFPSSIPEAVVAPAESIVHINFKIANLPSEKKLEQVFLQLVHSSGLELSLPVQRDPSQSKSSKTSIDYLISLNLKDKNLHKKLHNQSGSYQLILIIGDLSLAHSITWSLGSIQLDIPFVSDQLPLYHRPLLYESDVTLKALPEIHHIFREPAKRPSTIISSVFSLLVLAPTVVFVLVALAKISFHNVRASMIPEMVVFHGLLLAVLVLFFFYWIRLSMFTVLGYLAFLSIGLIASGYRLFSDLESSPTAKPKQE